MKRPTIGSLARARRDAEPPEVFSEPPAERPKRAKYGRGEAIAVIEKFGLDALCAAIAAGHTMTAIALELDVELPSLRQWINSDASRSARVREVRTETAWNWDEMALDQIQKAKDAHELGVAREAAFHLRWRASKIAPKEYGDRSTVDLHGTLTLEQLVTQSLEKK